MIKEISVGEGRAVTKAYLKLFIAKIVIDLPRIDITCKSKILLAALENRNGCKKQSSYSRD